MAAETPQERLRNNATEIAAVVVTGIWMAALFAGVGWWLGFLLFGYIVVVPLIALLYGDDDDRTDWWGSADGDWWDTDTASTADSDTDTDTDKDISHAEAPLETLRRRYAAGELSDEQFERKVARLLETETLEDVEDSYTRSQSYETDRN